ncbi:iron complex outermembrane receptor protein [Sphingobium sp. OAS761]|uniref:TonB-dependent receptor n=1 Tax=Sphingobium sp. OAS761 TaxID=2817901 RepID=UPI0020A21F3A|nr:TonB-dependent receptor [Sphingobium sp. OAS761]MCP1472415.1 iron complex outermembrane receptor protein [Sphingobium sp. OAS761]
MSLKVKSIVVLASVSIGALIVSAPASAQESTGATALENTASANEARLADIIVTARRSSENIQKVPVAVSVLSGEVLEQKRITGARDLQYSTPSLVVTNDPLGGSTAPVFQLRGQTVAQGSDDTVVTYLGDVPVNSRAFSGGLFDLNSVQVIRGPQGTLFGKNSTGGAVVFTPRIADTNEVSGFVDGTVGNYSYYQIGAGVNVPLITDKLAVRVSGQITRQDGFTRNLSGPDGGDKKYEVLRLSLVATPTDELRNETYLSYYHGRQHQNPLIFSQYNPTSVYNAIFFGLLSKGVDQATADGTAQFVANIGQQAFDGASALGPRTIDYSVRPNNDDNDVFIVTNTTSYDLGFATLKNIFGYYNQKPKVSLSQTSTNFAFVDISQNKNQNSFSNELQLSGDSDTLKWIIGAFFSTEKTSTFQRAFLFGSLATDIASTDKYTSKALFAQGTYDFTNIGLAGVKFTAGIRHTWDTRRGVLDVVNYPGAIVVPTVQNRKTYKNFSWTLGLDYQVTPDLLLYVASRHSYKAGGLNLVASESPPELQTYAPEKLTDIELGAKAKFDIADVAVVRTNVAAYRGWYKGLQFQELANCGTVATFVINAGKATPKGLEFEFDAAINRNLRIGGFYNRTLGKFDKFELVEPAGCAVIGSGVNLNGADFGHISKDTAGLNASYTVPLTHGDEALVFAGDWYYRGARVGVATQGVASAIPSYSLFNARIDYNNIGGSQFSAGVWVRNIGNKLFVAYRNNVQALSGYDSRAYGDPRTFGMDVKFKF